jgi:hypothetical protein
MKKNNMKKALLYRLFGYGKIPEKYMKEFKKEGIRLIDEGLKGSVTYKNFKAPGKYFSWKRHWFVSSLVLTSSRLAGLRGKHFIMNVPLSDTRIRKIDFRVEKEDVFTVSYEAGLFHHDWEGQIELRFRSALAEALLDALQKPKFQNRNSKQI